MRGVRARCSNLGLMALSFSSVLSSSFQSPRVWRKACSFSTGIKSVQRVQTPGYSGKGTTSFFAYCFPLKHLFAMALYFQGNTCNLKISKMKSSEIQRILSSLKLQSVRPFVSRQMGQYRNRSTWLDLFFIQILGQFIRFLLYLTLKQDILKTYQ